MKRIIALILAVLCLTVMLSACSKKKTCEFCGEKSSDVKTRTIDGEKGDLCQDCYDGLKALSELNDLYG